MVFVPINYSFSGQRLECGPVPGLGPQNVVEGARRSGCNAALPRSPSSRLDAGMKGWKQVVPRFHKQQMRRQGDVAMGNGGLDTDLVTRGRFFVLDVLGLK